MRHLQRQLILSFLSYDMSPTAQRVGAHIARLARVAGATALVFALAWVTVYVLG